MEDKDLTIIIECEPVFCDVWMSFASWYSIQKKMPNSQVLLSVENSNFFRWANRCGIKIFRNQFKIENLIKKIRPSVMAVRDFTGNLDVISSKTDIVSTFVDYRFGCGSFDLDKWVNIKKPPFENALKKFSTIDLTINEYAVLDIWEQCCFSYKELVGGVT